MPWPPGFGVDLGGGRLIDTLVDRGQCIFILGIEEFAAGAPGDIGQQAEVHPVFPRGLRVANADGVDFHAIALGDGRCVDRRHAAGCVVAIGEQNQNTFFDTARFKGVNGQADGIAQRCLRPRHGDGHQVHQGACGGEIPGERQLYIGFVTKHDQAHAVGLALGDERLDYLLHGPVTGNGLAVAPGEIPVVHGAREVNGEHDVARDFGAHNRFTDPVRPHQRDHQQKPDEPEECGLRAAPTTHHRTGPRLHAGRGHDVGKEGHAQGAGALPVWRQTPPQQQRQRQGEHSPGKGKLKHGAPAPSAGPPPVTAGRSRARDRLRGPEQVPRP